MESKKINQLATELAPDLSDLTIIGDPTTGISKKITLSQMASLFTGTVEEYATLAAFPLVGVADTIYIALDTNIIYRYDTSLSAYVILSPNIINSLVFSDANGFDGTITLVGSVATLSITTALTLGSVPFIGASGALIQDNSNLFFDDTNNRLGINTNAPTTALDVFGSGIIGRLNATSTNNAYLGFASNGTNKWSAGNVQSDHRFRIFSEANSAELITILQTGEFGIGIANPLTKFHIDGGATALIANLDANVSVAKSISFRSDNSNRINLEVSGTESGSNAGADFFLRAYSDAGALLNTPLTIVRSTGNATFIGSVTATALIPTGSTIPTNGMYLSAANTLNFATNSTNRLLISSTGTVSIGSASSGGTFSVYGTAGVYAGYFQGAQSGTSRGLYVDAGLVDTDNSFLIRNAPGTTDLFKINGIGNGTLAGSLTLSSIIATSDIKSNSGASDGQVVLSKMGGTYYGGGTYYAGDNGTNQSGFRTGLSYAGSTTKYVIERSTTTQSYGANPTALTYTPAFSIALASGNIGINTIIPAYTLDVSGNVAATRFYVASGGNATDPMIRVKDDTDTGIFFPDANTMAFSTGATERIRLTSGNILEFNNGGTKYGQIKGIGGEPDFCLNGLNGQIVYQVNSVELYGMDSSQFYPAPDNTLKLGTAGNRWTTVYATNGSINTSDRNEKEQIENLNESELKVALKLKSLIKKFKFKDSVIEKGDNARIHVGVIAQEVEQAFISENLDPNKYGVFCSDTFWQLDDKNLRKFEEGAIEITRLGVRYDQLFAFIISVI